MFPLSRAARVILLSLPLAALSAACDKDEPGPETPEGGTGVVTPGGSADVCPSLQCPVGTVCNESTDACEPTSSSSNFCASVRCPVGTVCNEQTDACEELTPPTGSPPGDYCSLIVCPAGTSCNPLTGWCDQSGASSDFCSTINCPPGTVCNEQSDLCEVL
jgi:hypothetical protein